MMLLAGWIAVTTVITVTPSPPPGSLTAMLRPAGLPLPRWAQKGPDLGRAGATGHQNHDSAPQTTPAPPHRGAPARESQAAEPYRRRSKRTISSRHPRAARAHGKGLTHRRQHQPGGGPAATPTAAVGERGGEEAWGRVALRVRPSPTGRASERTGVFSNS
jgi:hypothetical protein